MHIRMIKLNDTIKQITREINKILSPSIPLKYR